MNENLTRRQPEKRYPQEFRDWAAGVLALNVYYFLETNPNPELFSNKPTALETISTLFEKALQEGRLFRPIGDVMALVGENYRQASQRLMSQSAELPSEYQSEAVGETITFPKTGVQTIQNKSHMDEQAISGFGSGFSALTNYHVLERIYGQENFDALVVASEIARNVNFAFFGDALEASGDLHWEDYNDKERDFSLIQPGKENRKIGFVNQERLLQFQQYLKPEGCLALDPVSEQTATRLNAQGINISRKAAIPVLDEPVSQMVDNIVKWVQQLPEEDLAKLDPKDLALLAASYPNLPRSSIQPKSLLSNK